MILAQNLLPRLSGNNWYKLLIIVLFIGACTPLKPISETNSDDGELEEIVNDNPKMPKVDDKDVVVIDIKNNNGNTDKNPKPKNPKQPQNPKDTTNPKGGVDKDKNNNPDDVDNTNKKPDDVDDPNAIDSTTVDEIDSYYLKSTYNVSILMPLQADKVNTAGDKVPSSAVRGMNFYEGSLLALQQLSAEGINLDVSIFDTKRSTAVVQALVDNKTLETQDLIIGPASTDNLRIVANATQKTNTPVVSLNLSSSIASENPSYIQASPYFATHADAIMEYVKTKYAGRNIVLAVPAEGNESNRFYAFRNADALLSSSLGSSNMKEYIDGKTDKRAYQFKDIQNYLTVRDTTVFIVPSSNQEYVSGLLRTLSLTRNRFPVVVFGLPSWLSFEKIDYQYYENLNVHVSSSTYINKQDIATKNFEEQFKLAYGMFPTSEAYKGYDLMLYFGRMLNKYGTGFLNQLEENPAEHLHSIFAFERVPINTGSIEEGNYRTKQFENKYVNILRFRDFYFQRVNSMYIKSTTIDPTRN